MSTLYVESADIVKLTKKIERYEILMRRCKNGIYLAYLRFKHRELLREYQSLTGKLFLF